MSGTSAILIGLNAGDYETIDLSQWIAANPKEVLATISASRQKRLENFWIAMSSSPARMVPDRTRRRMH
jgi:hypothetical protein